VGGGVKYYKSVKANNKESILLKMRLKEMKISSLLKVSIYEVNFGYTPKMEGYTTSMSNITKL